MRHLPLSPLEPQSSPLIGGGGERQALELRVREVEEENRALRRELSQPPRSPSRPQQTGHHGNNGTIPNSSEDATKHNEAQRGGVGANGSDCVQQPAVDKCEVSGLSQTFVTFVFIYHNL